MISWLALDDREMVIIKIGRGEHLHFNRKRPKTSTLGRLGINGLKKFSGKFESFVHKLIKNNHTVIFWYKYFEIFQLQGSTRDSTQRPLPLRPQNPSLRHFTSTIRDYDKWLRSFVTLTRHFDNSSQRQKSVSFWVFLSEWQIVEMTYQSDGWSTSRVEVTDGWSHVSKWRILGPERE